MRVLITGSSVLEKLREGHEVFGLDLKPSPYTTIIGDVEDRCEG